MLYAEPRNPRLKSIVAQATSLQRSVSKYLLEYRVIPYPHTVHTYCYLPYLSGTSTCACNNLSLRLCHITGLYLYAKVGRYASIGSLPTRVMHRAAASWSAGHSVTHSVSRSADTGTVTIFRQSIEYMYVPCSYIHIHFLPP